MDKQQAFYTANELAAYFRFDLDKIYRMVYAKQLPFIRCGRNYRFPVKAIEEWIANGGAIAPIRAFEVKKSRDSGEKHMNCRGQQCGEGEGVAAGYPEGVLRPQDSYRTPP